MSERSIRMKWKKRLGRWIAVAITVTLLAGQCNFPALAEEDIESGQGSSMSDNDIGDDIENNIPQCVCTVKCSEESVNGECAVCLADYLQCSSEIVEGSTDEELPDLEEELPDIENVVLEETPESEEMKLEELAIESSSNSFDDGTYSYNIINADSGRQEVECAGFVRTLADYPTEVIIPGEVQGYTVTGIGKNAFVKRNKLKSIIIPDGVTTICEQAFNECDILAQVKLPDSLESIGNAAFANCYVLSEINIPANVRDIGGSAFIHCKKLPSVEIPYGVTEIKRLTFSGCTSLESITIPETVQNIGETAFQKCTSLTQITIPSSVEGVGDKAFDGCSNLTNLYIAITMKGDVVKPITVGSDAFNACPPQRYVHFRTTDNKAELTETSTPTRAAAENTYDLADDADIDHDWYGWTLGNSTGGDAVAYTVTINVRKDNKEWTNHGKTFALLANGSSEFLFDLEHVPNGTYRIYDVTRVRRDSLWSKAADTGVNVRVNGADMEMDVIVYGADEKVNVDYYTVTFFDEDDPYGVDTDQGPQVVLKDKAARRPSDPGKADHVFTGWVTAKGGSTQFDFTKNKISNETGIYASWRMADNATDISTEASTPGGGSNSTDDSNSNTLSDIIVITTNAENKTAAVTTENSANSSSAAAGNSKPATSNTQQGTEPKTGDSTYMEMYATIAMIAGFTYLLLYFMEERCGMTEREKEVFVAAFIRWAKKGGTFRKCCALVAIACILAYYHSVGKRTEGQVCPA